MKKKKTVHPGDEFEIIEVLPKKYDNPFTPSPTFFLIIGFYGVELLLSLIRFDIDTGQYKCTQQLPHVRK